MNEHGVEADPVLASQERPSVLSVDHWELLIVFVLLLGIFALRQTGGLPGATLRLLDLLLVGAILALAMRVAGLSRGPRLIHGAIALGSIVVGVAGIATSSVTLQRIASGISGYVLTAAFFFIVWFVLRQQHVTVDTLFGALAAYVAVAIIFAMIYTFVARTDPGVFEPPQPVIDGQTDLYYFSFVTLTSLGYGDIAPASDLIRVLAPIEAVIGAILLAALVGRIVGLLVAQTTESRTQTRLDALVQELRERGRLDEGP